MVLRTPSFVCECTSGSCIAGLSACLSRELHSSIFVFDKQLRGSVTFRTGQRSSGSRQEFDAEVDVIEDRKVFMKATKNARQQDFKEVSVSNFWELLKHRWAYISETDILTMSSVNFQLMSSSLSNFLFILPQLDEWRKTFGERQRIAFELRLLKS
ncbi:uncharacterized protein IUM83_14820 [Phytophthora cinnamomi]|uniref:uncharacterized protein n=1 Tax=Phytophthora cinnamomi TaxID=4785 RepID=UPI00355A3348|nr:hypothetical protein IUM83_14820 [Phytophthora cinnamomi]